MRPTILMESIAFAIKQGLPILIKGAPGVGKSDIVAQACEAAGAELIISHPVVSDPTDYKGLPFPDKEGKEAHFLPFGELNRLIHADKLTVFFLDDLGQAAMSVQAACMQLILARRINGHHVSEHIVFMAATNRRADRAGVQGILEPVKSRFAFIVELMPTVDDWVLWAYKNDMPAELISFIKYRPNLLFDFNPTGDIVNSPCPRTVAHVGKIMNGNPASHIAGELYAGAAGPGFAAELEAYLKVWSKLPSFEDIMAHPDKIKVPTEPDMLYATAGLISSKLSGKNIPAVYSYIVKLPDEFQMMIMNDVVKIREEKTVARTSEFVEWSYKHIGQLL